MPLEYEPESIFVATPYTEGTGFFGQDCDPHEAVIGYDNIFNTPGVVLTSSAQATGINSQVENPFDWLTYDVWGSSQAGFKILLGVFPQPVSADYYAISNYSFPADTILWLQYWDGAAWQTARRVDAADIVASNGAPIMVTFPEQTSDQWRILLQSTGTTIIGVFTAGISLPIVTGLRVGFAPPQNGEVYEAINNVSQGANLLGRSVTKKTVRTAINFDYVPYEWIQDNWRPFVRHYERRPFFFNWSNNRHPEESAFCWNARAQNPPPSHKPNFYRINFQFESTVTK